METFSCATAAVPLWVLTARIRIVFMTICYVLHKCGSQAGKAIASVAVMATHTSYHLRNDVTGWQRLPLTAWYPIVTAAAIPSDNTNASMSYCVRSIRQISRISAVHGKISQRSCQRKSAISTSQVNSFWKRYTMPDTGSAQYFTDPDLLFTRCNDKKHQPIQTKKSIMIESTEKIPEGLADGHVKAFTLEMRFRPASGAGKPVRVQLHFYFCRMKAIVPAACCRLPIILTVAIFTQLVL